MSATTTTTAGRRLLPGDPQAATFMRSIAVLGIVAGMVLTLVGWRFLGDLDRNLDQSLTIGEDAAATLSETIDVADDVVVSLDEGLTTLRITLDTLDATLTDTSELADVTADLAADLPAGFEDVDAALATVESLSGAIDAALRGASRLPLGPDYDPDVPLPDAVAHLRLAFDPIGRDLRSIADSLGGFASGSDELRTRIGEVQIDLERTQRAVRESGRLLDDYRATADRAGEVATSSRDDFGRSIGWARIAIVLLGAFVAIAQYIPWWLGGRLRLDPGGEPDATRGKPDRTVVAA